MIESERRSRRISLAKFTLNTETFVVNFVLNMKPWTYGIKDLKGETIIGNFYEKVLLLSIL